MSAFQSKHGLTSEGQGTVGADGKGNQVIRNAKELQKWKLFGRQFLSMDVMFDALFLLSKHDSEYKLRVPLSALIDYKGFRCIAFG